MTTRRPIRTVAALAVAALTILAAGCGDDDDSAATTAAASAETATPDTGATGTEPASTDTASSGSSAASSEWEAIVTAAQEEGEVTIYSSQGLDQLNELAADFEDEYGIKVTVFRAVDNDMQAKLQAERDSGQQIADLVVQATLAWQQEKSAEGWFTPVELPNFDQADYNRELNVSPDSDYFVASAAVLTFGWNTDLWSDGLTDYPDLLNPELKGQVGVIEPTVGSIVDFYLYLEEQFGTDFVEQLAAQEPKIYPSSLPMGEALASGEIAAGSFVQIQDDAKAKGAPTDSGLSETVWGAIFNAAVLVEAPHPNAAMLLADYLIGPDGQEDVAHLAASVLPGIPGTAAVTTDDVRRQDLSLLTPDAIQAYQARWAELFQG